MFRNEWPGKRGSIISATLTEGANLEHCALEPQTRRVMAMHATEWLILTSRGTVCVCVCAPCWQHSHRAVKKLHFRTTSVGHSPFLETCPSALTKSQKKEGFRVCACMCLHEWLTDTLETLLAAQMGPPVWGPILHILKVTCSLARRSHYSCHWERENHPSKRHAEQ